MKLFTKTLAVVAALVLAQSASAQTNVYITGSTAFRSGVETLLGASPTNTIFDSPPTVASVGTAVGASFVNYTGTIGGASVRVKCSFTGSAGGIFLVAHNTDATPPKAIFLADTAVTGTGNTAPTSGTGDVHICDIAFSDAFQLSSFFPTPSVPTDNTVGIVTFKWVGNYSMAQGHAGVSTISNITSQQVQSLYSGAFLISVAQMTGSTAALDQSTFIFAMGRDFDSGTRITAFSDSDNGATTSPVQWQPFMNATSTSGGSGGTNNWVGTPAGSPAAGDQFVAQIRQWNATSPAFIPSQPYTLYNNVLTVDAGNGGFNSGGDLAKTMRSDTNTLIPAFYNAHLKGRGTGKIGYNSTSCTGAYFLTYLGISDAATALNAATGGAGGTFGQGPGKELAYNGVAYSSQAIQTGQYSFWGYEHMLTNEDTGDGSAISTVYNAVQNAVTNNSDATQGGAGLLLSSMLVARSIDGAAITAGYY